MRCPRCSAALADEQDWCLECGAAARTRLAPTPHWQLPTIAIAAIVLVAGALFAFAFVKLTGDGATTPAQTAPLSATQPVTPPAAVAPAAPAPTITATTPSQTQTTAPPTSVPGQKAAPALGRSKKTKPRASATSPKHVKRRP
jgi:cytoskeletal protein RodZ